MRHETLSDVLICAEEWTPDNQMLTAAFKLNRNEIYKNFKKEIDAMYARLAK
jgi:long-subunit acyl-CoA synthetase (AMP-forming)